MTVPVPREPGGGAAEVVFVLCLLQVAFLALAATGEILLMGGNPAYLLVPAAKVVLVLVFAAGTLGGRRYALVGLIVLQCLTLAGFGIQLWAGLLPAIDHTVNLVSLVTNVVLPGAIVYLCASLLPARRTADRTADRTPPQPPRPGPTPAAAHDQYPPALVARR